ncbi:MAG TPA: FAD-binding oxidoreductase [Casimicrobiaceae bacterium]|nr:FAD-binding oxidoreductase [Casimicrobiaceae bacterium]
MPNRRELLRFAGATPFLRMRNASASYARPGHASWPSPSQWAALDRRVEGRLIEAHSPLELCANDSDNAACRALFARLKNPYYVRDEPALTQTLGWIDAWTSAPSPYAIAATKPAHVVAAVDFARTHRVRLAVRGGGHSYQGTSNAPDSLLVWTRYMDGIGLHDAFVPRGCERVGPPAPAVSIGAGAIWMHAYEAVTTKAGRYVQGGGCATVGVAGLVQSGGFGSFSKNFGIAAAGLLEAEVVTADGAIRVVNACRHPDLFWALRGGGGATYGIVTRLTLRTHELPTYFGGAFGTIEATSDTAFRELISRFLAFYRERLFNAHWGEQVTFSPARQLRIAMVFQGLDRRQAMQVFDPFVASIKREPQSFAIREPLAIAAIPARNFWDPAFLRARYPSLVVPDDREGASPDDILWRGDQHQVAQYLHGYTSTWLPASLLREDAHGRLVDALLAAARHWSVDLHFSKGLAGAPADAIDAAKRTAMNPAVLDAFALAIVSGGEPPAYPGIFGHAPDVRRAREDAQRIQAATAQLRRNVPDPGSYLSESDYFESDWQRVVFGRHYARLRAIKARYDPHGLFTVHHGVGSDRMPTT